MDSRYRFLTSGIPWTQSMPSRDVNDATRFAEASWRRDNAVLPTKPDQNMTNLRCTADRHVVPLLNIRHVESAIIPDHFLTG